MTGDGDCDGGQLVYARPGGELQAALREVGVPIAHYGHEVHGVTALHRGVRWGLFFVKE